MLRSATLSLLLIIALISARFAAAADPRPVIGYVARDLNNFPPILAQAKGFFRDAGVAPELVQIRSNVALAGLLGGSVDYTTAFSTSIGRAVHGAPLRAVLAMVAKPSFYLVARPEIRTVADLKGKVIGVGAIASTNHIITQKVLANFGVGADDVTIVATGDYPLRMAALKSGAIQATMAAPPAPVQAKQWGFNVLAYAGDYVDLPLAGLATTTSKIKESRAEVVSVITAILRALLFMRAERPETILLIQKLLKMEKGLAETTYDLSIQSFSVDGTASNKGLQNVIEMSQPARPVAPADVFDFAPLREAQATLGVR